MTSTPDPARDEAPDLRHKWDTATVHGCLGWRCTRCQRTSVEDHPPGDICAEGVNAVLADRDAEILRLRTELASLTREREAMGEALRLADVALRWAHMQSWPDGGTRRAKALDAISLALSTLTPAKE